MVSGNRDSSEYDVIVVGGGHNGLVASFYLARAGLKVLVLERRSFVGGACATEELFPGYRVSSCSYVCWMLQPEVIRDMELERCGFRYMELDPGRFNPYKDGASIVFWTDPARTKEEIAKLNAHDAASYVAWNDLWFRASGLVHQFFMREPPTLGEVLDHARNVGEEQLLERLLTTPLGILCEEYFEDTRIQAALVQLSDMGDPWQVGSAWIEAYFHANTHIPLSYGLIQGGMGAITQAMAQAAKELGVEIRCEAEVERIFATDGRVCGVRTANGKEITSSVVVSNADPKRTFLRLLDSDALEPAFRRKVEVLSTQVSYLKFHAVMDRLPDISRYLDQEPTPQDVAYIHIAPSLEHYHIAYREARQSKPPREPIVHIQIPTVYDSTLTAKDGHVVSIWTQYAPPRLANGSWDERRQSVGEALIDYVTEFLPNFRLDMREWRLFTPDDLEQRVGLTDGNIRHLDMIPAQFLDQRPILGGGYATPIEGLYLCGAGTHPGGEVTGAPGHNAAHTILRQVRQREAGQPDLVRPGQP